MNPYETLRIFKNRPEQIWKSLTENNRVVNTQYEIGYTEYRSDGSVKQTGTEDFTPTRTRQLHTYRLWTWNGLDRNKGGYRKFKDLGYVTIYKKDKQKTIDYFKTKYPDSKIIELR